MHNKIKTIHAITTIINGQINYISGQSINAANKFIPTYNKDAQMAKEFANREAAELYLKNVSTQVQRKFTPITVDIIDKNEIHAKIPVVVVHEDRIDKQRMIKKMMNRFLIFIAAIVLVSCSRNVYSSNPNPKKNGCPSQDQNKINKHANRPMKA
jgi:uncharacterized protein YlxP (DUF503 family)